MIANLAWRNIWRNKTRSTVVIVAISLGIVSALVLDAFYLGMVKTFIEDSINKTTAHLQMHKPEFLEDEDVRFVLDNSDQIVADLDAMEEIRSSASRIIVNAMLGTSRTTRSLKIRGIDPERETTVADLRPYLIEGSYFDDNSRNPILISTLTAEKAGLKLGSKVVLTFQDISGEITSGLFRVRGLFDTGSNMIDQSAGFVRKTDMYKTIDPTSSSTGNYDHEIAILLHDIDLVNDMSAKLNQIYPSISTQSYREISPQLDLYESQIDTMTWFYFLIIMAALIFGIVNTMLMAVLERYREFGVLMSLGMGRMKLFGLVILETLSLCLTAAPVGILLGLLVIYILSKTGVDLSMWSEFLEQYGMASMIYPEINPTSFTRLIIAISFTAILAAIYPAWKAIRLNPLEALRKI